MKCVIAEFEETNKLPSQHLVQTYVPQSCRLLITQKPVDDLLMETSCSGAQERWKEGAAVAKGITM